MRPFLLLVFLVTLHLLLCGAYGARLGKFAMNSATTSQPTDLVPVHENENTVVKRLDDDQNNIIVDKREISIQVKCKDDEEHCSSKGKYRKLITTSTTIPISSAKPIKENLDNIEGNKRMDTKRDDKAQTLSSPSIIDHNYPSTVYAVDKHQEIGPPEYENAMDMTVMDYSPAKKKPPIHN